MKSGTNLVIFIVYVLFGLYFLNSKLVFFVLPETISNVNLWITFAGGVLLILGALKFLMSRTTHRYDPRYKRM